jgi:hypothetical protein
MSSWYEPVLDWNVLPDAILRLGIRKLLRDRLAQEDHVRTRALASALLWLCVYMYVCVCASRLAACADARSRGAWRRMWRPSWPLWRA